MPYTPAGRPSRFAMISQLAARWNAGLRAPAVRSVQPPLRAELFNADQMERHGRALGTAHRVGAGGSHEPLLPRLAENEAALLAVCEQLGDAVSRGERISPAGEWLLDNFHLVEEHIALAKRHLPRGYSRELPRLGPGPSAGLPRVYDIALETIAHGDGRIDGEGLARFVAAYQTRTPLALGELWAIPIMLRLALVENLRRVAVRISAAREERALANAWADRMILETGHDPTGLILVVADMARSNPPMGTAFVAEFARRRQGQSAALALPLTWIEQRLSQAHRTIEDSVLAENRQQAADQVSLSNSIGSLRFVSAHDWRDFVEDTSAVESALRQDPAGVYAAMTFESRDRYRHAIERIARQASVSEAQVAALALERARHAAGGPDGSDNRRGHVGYFLVGPGLVAFERDVGVKHSLAGRLRAFGACHPLPLYLGAIAAITVALAAWLVGKAGSAGASPLLQAAFVLPALLCASQAAVLLVNAIGTRLVSPRPLPRLDFSEGLTPEVRTLVVVPTMLTDPAGVESLVEALEVRFLANRDPCLHFGLLTDFPDAPVRELPADDPLLQLAARRIRELNLAYGPAGTSGDDEASIFYLFHRPRLWNAGARAWMGEERKRGKLEDLNALLRGAEGSAFSLMIGATPVLAKVKFVITLDTDTELPRDAARQFIGALAHPLNRARFEEREGRSRITEGHAILQPRVCASLTGAHRSRYARLFAGDTGIDPYTRLVSDLYQDAFGEGSYIGKGIYDVDAFERALHGRFPSDRILSHDLIEGCYARAGLLADAELYEAGPSRYGADVARRHRWVRGDWQLAGWLRREVRLPDGSREPNPLSPLSQWKLFDNLRRSLVPAALVALLALGWALPAGAAFWTAAVLAFLLLPAAFSALSDLATWPAELSLARRLRVIGRGVGRGLARNVQQAFVALAFLAHEAAWSLDAILLTLARVFVTRRSLLEWTPSSESGRSLAERSRTTLAASFREMAVAPALVVLAFAGLAAFAPAALGAAAPILLLWVASPAIAWWISRPPPPPRAELAADETRFLRGLARRTWAYFETHVGPQDHWLPPDNVQEAPVERVAHRTSPTNMGLALLADLSAHDFGYLTTGQLIERTTLALRTMQSLERHRGHFYNWYDTLTLAPLAPHYISSVDSGNLAGHLLTLRPGLANLADAPILGTRWLEGLEDTYAILAKTVGGNPLAPIESFRQCLARAAGPREPSLAAAWIHVDQLATCAADTIGAAAPLGPEALFWARALARQGAAIRDDLLLLAPWLERGPPAPPLSGADAIPTLRQLACHAADTAAGPHVLQGAQRAATRIAALDPLARQALAMADMDFDFLYDRARRQLVIGYNVTQQRADSSCYDLLASEARLALFVAIAQGKLPQESWFALGRLLTSAGGDPVLLAWSGSMFEYLMPLLVMPSYDDTLLAQTCDAAVARQVAYGRQRGVPWGISESGYNAVDVQLNYQYRAFGVPGLGLKRGLAEDLVVAPYACALALLVAPEAACRNLQRLAAEGLAGHLGLHEAIDYTPSRQRPGEASAVVRSYMAHHQAMSQLAIASLLLGRPMQRRFAAEPLFQATLLLLQERIPRAALFPPRAIDRADLHAPAGATPLPARVFTDPNTTMPAVQLLSNGRYQVMVTNAGSGSSRWKDLAVTRWREDTTADPWGSFCYLRDEASGDTWSNAFQPTLCQPEHYEAIFSEGRAEFRRRDAGFETHTEIVVSPEDDIEVRRIRVTNRGRAARAIEITSYAEVVLAPPAADALHPAFSNLFVTTEILPERHAIVCSRRARSLDEPVPWMFHLMTTHGTPASEVSYETDRMRFIGRGRTVASPLAMAQPGALSGTAGSVLDPVASIRHRLVVPAGGTVTVDLVMGAASSRKTLLAMIDKHRDRALVDRVFELAWTHAQVMLRQLDASEADAQLYARLAGSLIYANPSLRAPGAVIARNRRGQSGLWRYAVSGDLPIVLVQIGNAANIELVKHLVRAHAYWRLKGLEVDLVIWNEDHDGYRQQLQEQIVGLIAAGVETHGVDRPGGIIVRNAEQISAEDRTLFQSVARAIVNDDAGTLAEQLQRRVASEPRPPRLDPVRTWRAPAGGREYATPTGLILSNGIGAFRPDGREYVIAPGPGETTPAPWANVMANPRFGTVVSESGLGYTWGDNAHLYRLTPWHNDPVNACGSEAIYLRDEDTGHFHSPTPLPCGGASPCVTRHGFGYSVFERAEDALATELTTFVARDAAVKFYCLKVTNASDRVRRLSVTAYVEWVLGALRAATAMHVSTEIDARTGALYARNPYNNEFPRWVAFLDVDDPSRVVSGDRAEFLGRNGTMGNPAALHRTTLSGKVGAGLDPCAAMQVSFELSPGVEHEVVFRLGAAPDAEAADRLVRQLRGPAAAREALEAVIAQWDHVLTAVQIETPEPALDVLANGWLLYQAIACRLWARSGYYQSGGAYGFRDQLQDAMALTHTEPRLLRDQIVLCAGRQFREGDVQHWWHLPTGQGVRTRCSDDYLWLPLAASRYVLATADASVLDERVAFLEGRPVKAGDDSYYDRPARADESATVYEHCMRAIVHGLRYGERGLPLMGSGDWNDGMNRVGIQGRGESVWLAFFLCRVLADFAPLARAHGDVDFADRCDAEAVRLRGNIETHAWDGEWYRRAWFDDGTPLGSRASPECRIDSVAQSWSVLSGAGDPDRSRAAMQAVQVHLVRPEHALIQLLDPPFDTSPLDPGYIRGYVPGVRENGGQYTHGAIWAAMACAALGQAERAWGLTAMINPVNHSRSPEGAQAYKVEPFVMAADVYAREPHAGRGGWTWYTGSAGWMYRLVIESLIGLTREGSRLRCAPCLPADGPAIKVRYRFGNTVYRIEMRCGDAAEVDAATLVVVDGVAQAEAFIDLNDDGRPHEVVVQAARR